MAESLMAYAEKRNIPIEMKRGKKSPFSMDANLLRISFEGGPLEDPFTEPPAEMWRWSVSPEMAPNEATYLDLTYEKGDIVAIDGWSHDSGQVSPNSTVSAVRTASVVSISSRTASSA